MRILIVEDDRALNAGIKIALQDESSEILSCFDLTTASALFEEQQFDLVLLDINLPDGNGFEFCQTLRRKSKLSIIILTAKDLEIDMVNGLEAGADDYITKPFSLAVLRARVKAQLRRQFAQSSAQEWAIDTFRFNFKTMQFSKKGTAFELSKTEQKLLLLLLENQGIIL